MAAEGDVDALRIRTIVAELGVPEASVTITYVVAGPGTSHWVAQCDRWSATHAQYAHAVDALLDVVVAVAQAKRSALQTAIQWRP